jgi:ATP-dependent RNA helicase RhlE
MSKDVKSLASSIQNKKPEIIQVGKERNPIDTITQHICPVAKELKMKLLLHILQRQQLYSVLIFSRTKHGADKICRKLKKEDIKAVAIHSNRTQSQRLQALDGFKKGKFYVMVATDIAARGIDVSGISHVINYDVPTYCEDYIHRIGRTGRAEAIGDAITFVAPEEMKYLKKIEKYIGKKFKMEKYEDFDYSAFDHPEITPHNKPHPSKRRNKYKKDDRSERPKRQTGGRPKSDRNEERGGKPRRKTSGRPGEKRTESNTSRPKRKTSGRPGGNKSKSKQARPAPKRR